MNTNRLILFSLASASRIELSSLCFYLGKITSRSSPDLHPLATVEISSAPTKPPLQSVDPPPKAGILWAHLGFQSWLIFFKVVRPRFGGSKADRILLGELDEYFKSMALFFQCDLSFPFYPRVKCPRYMNVVVLIPTDHHRTASAKDSYNNLKWTSIWILKTTASEPYKQGI